MADFKYEKKVNTTIIRGPRKGQKYTRYFYPGTGRRTIAESVAARRIKTIEKLEGERDKLMVEFNRTGNKRAQRKLTSVKTKIEQLHWMTRQGVF